MSKRAEEVSGTNWSMFRAEAAKDILAGFFNPILDITSQITLAVEAADKLIQQLKKEYGMQDM